MRGWLRKVSLIAPANARALSEGYNDDVRLRRISRTIHAEAQARRASAAQLSSLCHRSRGNFASPSKSSQPSARLAWMKVGEERFNGDDIRRLYESTSY